MSRLRLIHIGVIIICLPKVLSNYVGCFSREVLEGGQLEDITATGIDCQAICYNQDKLYSYGYQESVNQASYKSWCFCTDQAPDPNYLVADCNVDNGLTVIVPYQFAYHFVWYNCHSFIPSTPGTVVNSARDCWALCNPYSWAGVVYDQIDPDIITCRCYQYDDHPWYGTPAAECLPGSWFIYNHYPQPSGAVRRRVRASQMALSDGRCPTGLTACGIPGATEDSYECIDTKLELEHCGGWAHALALESGNTGVNCTALEGVTQNGVTCLAGECLIFACQEGYSLFNNGCIPDS
ncbi:uncharacterized protein I206_103583 [Kwoniella pini CBS 10737]|uniref:Protein CPL1-like domain-containing protein n=1 Tax=Kwoniella pini CBS 10737 TaxID=1296096 RepID=A0A1B9I9J2_9TREE|nr:uncharacterized protein I206_01412 [Kwoniella pini CBS 10737]OCF52127.1 hypothetical protein I206_01412 [Kwoniella pini CBS 10737]